MASVVQVPIHSAAGVLILINSNSVIKRYKYLSLPQMMIIFKSQKYTYSDMPLYRSQSDMTSTLV